MYENTRYGKSFELFLCYKQHKFLFICKKLVNKFWLVGVKDESFVAVLGTHDEKLEGDINK